MVAVGNHEYTHMPGLVVALTFPASADAVQYNALGASFGKQLTHWREPHVLRGEVVRAGGNYFKGHNLTESLCLDGKLPDAEELVQGRLLYKDRLVLVEAGECGYARKVKVAELYGAAGVILFDQDDKPPKWAETAAAEGLPLEDEAGLPGNASSIQRFLPKYGGAVLKRSRADLRHKF